MAGQYIIINLEEGMPLVEQAIKRLTFEIVRARASHAVALKLIHGFGSSGTGGRIRIEVRKYLKSLKNRGAISFFVAGEKFSIFDGDTRKALDVCTELRSDRDLDRHNNGVTIVIL